MHWQDVDLVAGRITVRQIIVWGHVGTPKSGKPREIPLGDAVFAWLDSQGGYEILANVEQEVDEAKKASKGPPH